MGHGRRWAGLLIVIVASFAVLGAFEPRIRAAMPPIPERV